MRGQVAEVLLFVPLAGITAVWGRVAEVLLFVPPAGITAVQGQIAEVLLTVCPSSRDYSSAGSSSRGFTNCLSL